MKKIRNIFLGIVGLALVVMGLIYLVAWKSPAYYELKKSTRPPSVYIPFALYTGEHARPFVIRTDRAVIFGAEHTRDPKHPQLQLMEKTWLDVQPTVALVEGRLGFLLPGLMDPVENLGEGGLVKKLASRSGIPVYNWDLSKEVLAAQLERQFTAEQIALDLVLKPYFSQLRFGKPADPGAFLKTYFKRAAYVGLQDSIKNVADLDRAWKKYFPKLDWRDVSDETTLPGFLNEMMIASNDLRNQQLIAVVEELTARGEKVFLVCGSSHAWCVAPAFGGKR